jgi:phosphoesterase RecJ-like protein
MNESIHDAIKARLHSAQKIVIFSHIRPDGDAIGSLIAMGLALQEAGKDVQMILKDGVPSGFRHLKGSEQIMTAPKVEADTIIVVDSSDLSRIGEGFNVTEPDIQVDHHITNLDYAKINLVVPEAVATSQILARSLPFWGLTINLPIAEALVTGIVTDSIGFRTSNMTPEALRVSADLMEIGVNLPELYDRALSQRSFEAARYWGKGLTNLQRDGRLIWTTLSRADRRAVGYNGNDDADLTNILSSVIQGDIAILFIEQNDHYVKVSWRSRPGWDVSKIALQFGGGGHPAAAGADVYGTLEEVQSKVLEATKIALTEKAQPVLTAADGEPGD